MGKYGADCFNSLRIAWQNNMKVNVSSVVKSVILLFEACFNSCCSSMNIKWELGNGDTIELWLDNWNRLGILKDQLNLIFSSTMHKTITVSQLMNFPAWEDLINLMKPTVSWICSHK